MGQFKQTDIGLIPEDWELSQLSEAAEIIMGQSPPSSTYNKNGNGLPFYQGKTDFGNIYPTNRIWCTSSNKIAQKNDILISVRAPVGPTNLSAEKCGIGRGLSIIRAKENYYLFLYYYLKKIEKEIKKLGTGSTFKAINKSQLYSIKIPLPPLPEQKKIAYVLSKIQQAIEKQEQIIKTTQELKKALMQKLFTEGLYGEPQKQTEIGPIPESWEVVEIEQLGNIITGSTPKTKVKEYYEPADIDFIAPADLGDNKYVYNSKRKISKKGLEVIRGLPKGSIMCVCIGSSIGKVGLTFKEISSTNQQINSIICYDDYFPEFIFYLLLFYGEYWRKFASPNPVPILSKGKFGQIEIPITKSRDEQEKISNYLSAIDISLELYIQKKEYLKQLFDSLLNKLMTGKIRVKDIDFDTEENKVS